MPTNHDAVAALPITGSASKTLLRNVVTARMPYVLADADVVTNLVAVDPSTGAAIIDILFLGRLFHYDSTDTTTANDGISCLVTSDGRRYKLSDGSDVFAYSVLSNAISAPPGSPAIGDAYLIASGATGAWAGKANYIGTFTRRGWEFINFGIGRFIYVESVESYYHKNSGGSWVVGLGSNSYQAGSIPITAVIGAKASFIIKVENQTTNTPPGSPTAPTAYIIGPSPTGSWAGNATKLAICLVNGAFTIIAPDEGDAVYDKALDTDFRFNGTAWVSAKGLWTVGGVVRTQTAFQTLSGASYYAYSNGTPPTQSLVNLRDDNGLTFAVPSATRLRFMYRCNFTLNVGDARAYTFGLFYDSVANALDWTQINTITGGIYHGATMMFDIAAPDANSHTYKVATMAADGSHFINFLDRRVFSYEGAV